MCDKTKLVRTLLKEEPNVPMLVVCAKNEEKPG